MTGKSKRMNAEKVAKAALEVFFNISIKWKLSLNQERILLGHPSKSKFMIWKLNEADILLKDDTLLRISYFMNIYKMLNTLLPSEEAANSWLNKPNEATVFKGVSALQYMLDGDILNIKETYNYLKNETV